MCLALQLHPDSQCDAAAQIGVEIARSSPAQLALRYLVTGTPGELLLPPPTDPARADGLWQHTCFEVFIRSSANPAYYEFNFAPSTLWAAYRFSGHRHGRSDVTEMSPPRIETRSNGDCYELRAWLELDRLPDLPRDAWQLGLSAVIEEAKGRKSYWALAHPAGKADFHHPDCFVLELPAA